MSVARPLRDAVQQQGPRRDRRGMLVCHHQPRKQPPPVVDQRLRAHQHPTALPILRREARPTPLVLQLVKVVLRVGPVAVVLCQRRYLFVERSHQHRIFVEHPLIDHFGLPQRLPLLTAKQPLHAAGLPQLK